MGTAVCDTETRDLQQVTLGLLSKAGYEVIIPDGLDGLDLRARDDFIVRNHGQHLHRTT